VLEKPMKLFFSKTMGFEISSAIHQPFLQNIFFID